MSDALLLNSNDLHDFELYLIRQERAYNTISKYISDIRSFLSYFKHASLVSYDMLLDYKNYLQSCDLTPGSINTKLCSINAFLNFKLRPDLKYKLLKIQRSSFRDDSRNLSKSDFKKLVSCASSMQNPRLYYLLNILAQTGIRVSELKYIDVNALKSRRVVISLKSKFRTIFIPSKLAKDLLAYCREYKIKSGPVFVTRTGHVLSRKQVWHDLKSLAAKAGVLASKVFPHNFRHLFAVLYYNLSNHDIVKLSDMLGHASINTTRIYLVTAGSEHVRFLNKLNATLLI